MIRKIKNIKKGKIGMGYAYMIIALQGKAKKNQREEKNHGEKIGEKSEARGKLAG